MSRTIGARGGCNGAQSEKLAEPVLTYAPVHRTVQTDLDIALYYSVEIHAIRIPPKGTNRYQLHSRKMMQ